MPAVLLDQSFYARCPKIVARELLGKVIVSTIGQRRSSGIVVETEAYLAQGDPACHGYRGPTPKNGTMFGPAGRAYVYPIHAKYCFNAVTQTPGLASAVLIRALQPIDGLATIRHRRGKCDILQLCSGPAKLCQALGIQHWADGLDLTRRRKIWLQESETRMRSDAIKITTRIGVTSAQNLMLRYVLADNPFASGPKYLR